MQEDNRIITRQHTAQPVVPSRQTTPHVIPDDTHRYPFRHPRQQPPVLNRARYANATIASTKLQANAVLNPLTGVLQEYRHLIKGPDKTIWEQSLANEFGRLTQGVANRIEGTNTMYFIPKDEVPFATKKVTYPKIVCDIRNNKAETHRTRITVGGNLLDYAGTLTTPTATITTAKCLFNSVVSTPGAKCAMFDIKNFYLNNDLPEPEYMKFDINNIPNEIITQYNLQLLVDNKGFVYVKIVKGMYGLKQAGIIAHKALIEHLKPYGYHPAKHTPGLWQHATRDTLFTLVVDDFAVKYTSKANAHHLRDALKDKYTISEDWQAKLYIGITLKWDYEKRTVDLSMPGYVEAALLRFRHKLKDNKQLSPHKHVAPQYGKKVQYAEPEDAAPLISEERRKFIQQVVGVFLYYAIAIDNTALVSLGDIGSNQTKATFRTMNEVKHLLDYLASNPNATIRYQATGMILFIHSDASYLSVTGARSRASGVFFLSDPKPDSVAFGEYTPKLNGFIFVLCKILRNIMVSAAEAEYGALFLNGQAAVPIRITLMEMYHPQPPTPIQVDNSTAVGIANKSIKQKRSKAMDMRFHWIIDRILQMHFNVFWKPGPTNLGDYHSKHHPTSHHIKVRHTNLYEPHSLQTTLQGCVNSPNRYTAGKNLGLNKGLHSILQRRGNNRFVNAVTAALYKPL